MNRGYQSLTTYFEVLHKDNFSWNKLTSKNNMDENKIQIFPLWEKKKNGIGGQVNSWQDLESKYLMS